MIREGGLESEAHRADADDPVYLERMEMVNDLCSWLKRYSWRFTGMPPRNLWVYLGWHVCSSGSTGRTTGGTRPQGWCAIS